MPDKTGALPGANGHPPGPQARQVCGPAEDLLEAALAEQRRAWLAGERVPVAEWLQRHPALAADPSLAAELVYHEFTLRAELGEGPDWEGYLRQFPRYAALLRLLGQADQVVEHALAPTAPQPLPAGRFGDFELLEELGRGGMGVVYKARQKSLDRVVALKTIRVEEGAGAEERRRFASEARAVARLQHPNVVQIYEVGEAGGQPFLALEFVEGRSLARCLNGAPLPARQAAAVAEALARAMHHAHSKGVVHRDLKPSNVLLAGPPEAAPGECVAKVTDFGLAKRLDAAGNTRTGAVLGTPGYMAPEQAEARAEAVGPRTDVYGLGAILYEMLTGRPPFRADTALETLRQVVQAEPARPGLLNPAVPRDLETVCLKCLDKQPGRRYATAEALADDLGRYLRNEPIRARRVGAGERLLRWCRRKPVVASLAAALVLVLVTGCVGITYQRRKAEAARDKTEETLAITRQALSELARVGKLPLTPEFDAQRRQHRDALVQVEALSRHLLEDPQASDEFRMTLAEVCGELRDLHLHFGDLTQARQAAEQAVAQWASLAEKEAGNRDYDLGLAKAHRELGQMLRSQGEYTQALASYRQAQARLEAHAGGHDTAIQADLIAVRLMTAECLSKLSDRAEARDHLYQTRDYLTRLLLDGPPNPALQHHLADTNRHLAIHLEAAGQADEARERWRDALDLYRQLTGQPDTFPLRQILAGGQFRLVRAGAGGAQGYAEAARLFGEAGRERARLAEVDPTSYVKAWLTGENFYQQALCHQAAGEDALALKACGEGVRLWEELERKRPTDPACSHSLLTSLALLAQLQEKRGLRDEAAATTRQIVERIDRFARAPGDRPQRALVAWHLSELAPYLRLAGKNVEAHQAAERSLQLYQQLVGEVPDELSFQVGLSQAWVQGSKYYWRVPDHERVLSALDQAVAVQRRVVEKEPAPVYLAVLDDRLVRRERALDALERREEVMRSVRERKALWAGNADRLRLVAANLRKLAAGVGPKCGPPTREECRWKDRYLAECARIIRDVEELPRAAAGGHRR